MTSTQSWFFEGDLQAGISLAITHDRVTVCFVTGNNDESLLWEETFLRDQEITVALTAKAITLRIEEGSLEADYLSAYHPISTAPTVILSYQGQLLLELKSGSSKDLFKQLILRALDASSPQPPSFLATRSAPSSGTLSSSAASSSPRRTDSMEPPGADLNQIFGRTSPDLPASRQPSSAVQDLLHDRRMRLEAEKKQKDAAEKADRRVKAGAQQEASDGPAKLSQASYAQQRRKRLFEEKLERERIMRAIQDDKDARKEREERRKALIVKDPEVNDGANCLLDRQLSQEIGNTNLPSAKECALQVRLFDGSTIRKRFLPNETLRNQVRAWIEEEVSDGDIPFTLKQILTPIPNRTISISQEEESLHTLGLVPSATLVKVPVQGYTTAYVADQGIIFRGISAGYNVASAKLTKLTGLVGNVLRFAWADTQEENTTPQVRSEAERMGAGVNIGSVRDQREDQHGHQIYNGNQLNFEPRKKGEDD